MNAVQRGKQARFVAPSKFEDGFEKYIDDVIEEGRKLREMLIGRRVLEPFDPGTHLFEV